MQYLIGALLYVVFILPVACGVGWAIGKSNPMPDEKE